MRQKTRHLLHEIQRQMGGTQVPELSPIEKSWKERAATAVCISGLYFVSVGVLYLWGYWSSFNINILEYLGLSDVIKSTAYPILSAFVSMIIAVVYGQVVAVMYPIKPESRVGRTLSRILPEPQLLRRHALDFAIIYFFVVFLVFTYLPLTWKWGFGIPLIAFPVAVFLSGKDFVISLVPNSDIRKVILILLAVLPPYSYGLGQLRADEILNSKSYSYLVSAAPVDVVPTQTAPSSRLRLIGHAGDLMFLWEPSDAHTVLMKLEASSPLVFARFNGKQKGSGDTASTKQEKVDTPPLPSDKAPLVK